MKLFLYEFAHDRKYGAFNDKDEAYEKRGEVDPNYHWMPVEITEVVVEGFDIAITPTGAEEVAAAPTGRGRGRRAAG